MTSYAELRQLRKTVWHRAWFFFFVFTGVIAAIGTKLTWATYPKSGWEILMGSILFFTQAESLRDLLSSYVSYFMLNGLWYLLIVRLALTSRLPEVRVVSFIAFAVIWLATGWAAHFLMRTSGC